MHQIEQQIYEFIEQVGLGKAELSDALIEEFGARCKSALKDRISELREPEFKLRMSNIGRPLRTLMLEKKYGRTAPTPDFLLKMLYGSLYEALTIALIKASNVNLTAQDKKVVLNIAGEAINGTLDVKIGNKVYDVKTASPYSFDNKFVSWETVVNSDDFGYVGQGFAYAIADGCKFGGWIVINKATGQIKVIEIPDEVYNELAKKVITELDAKITHINKNMPMPECDGVIEETYYKKPTGNKILNGNCKFCEYKKECHPGIKYLPSKASKSNNPKYTWYTEIKEDE